MVEFMSSPAKGESLPAIPAKDLSVQLAAGVASVQVQGLLAQGWPYAARINLHAVDEAVQDVFF